METLKHQFGTRVKVFLGDKASPSPKALNPMPDGIRSAPPLRVTEA